MRCPFSTPPWSQRQMAMDQVQEGRETHRQGTQRRVSNLPSWPETIPLHPDTIKLLLRSKGEGMFLYHYSWQSNADSLPKQ